MLTKSQILAAIQKSLVSYNALVTNQIDSKISKHNQPASSTASGHMTTEMYNKLAIVEENQNAISKIQIGEDVVSAAGKESTATFKGDNGINVTFDNNNAIVISGQLSSAVNNTANNQIATPFAVKTAYDKAVSVGNDLSSYKTSVANTYMPKSGGTFTGEVVLKADPTKTLGAATKQYADTKMPLSGGTFTGAVILSGAPETDLQAATKKYVDTAISNLVDSAPTTLNTLNKLAQALDKDDKFAATVAGQIGTKVDKEDGKGLSTNDYTTAEKTKLDGIASGAEVNQDAFSTIAVKVGTTVTNVEADTKQDVLTLVQGTNVTLTPSTTNDTITISATDTKYNDATTSVHGLMSTKDKTKLDKIADNAEVNQNAFSNIKVGNTTIASGDKTATLELVAGANVTLTPNSTNKKVTIAATDTTYKDVTQSVHGLMISADKIKLDSIIIETEATDEEISAMIANVQTAITTVS